MRGKKALLWIHCTYNYISQLCNFGGKIITLQVFESSGSLIIGAILFFFEIDGIFAVA